MAAMALRNLRDFAPAIVEISESIPDVVANELTDEGKVPSTALTAATEARQNACRVWEQAGCHTAM